MKKIIQANGKYIWCFVDGNWISPQGNGKSLEYAMSIDLPNNGNWKLFKLVQVKKIKVTIKRSQ